MDQACEVCKGPIEADGFCSWHGKFSEKWQCDDCVHKERGRSQGGIRPADPSTPEHIRHVLDVLDSNIRNMAMINAITGLDASTAERSVALSLNFRDSKAVYRMIAGYLREKLPPPEPSVPLVPLIEHPAQDATPRISA